jgi:hypothetical protein
MAIERWRRPVSGIALALSLTMLGHGLYFSHQQALDDRYLEREVLSHIDASAGEALLGQALSAAFTIPPHLPPAPPTDYGLKHPLLAVLGPPAGLIHQLGGHCGRRSRLLLTILEKRGVPAHKVHLISGRFEEFGHASEYVHAVVEARLAEGWVIADPLYHILYRRANGELAGLSDIRSDEGIFREGIQGADTRYDRYFNELYRYDEYRKFIWSSLPMGDRIYSTLARVAGTRAINDWPGPRLLEAPLKLIALLSYFGAGTLLVVGLLLRRSPFSPARREEQAGSSNGSDA